MSKKTLMHGAHQYSRYRAGAGQTRDNRRQLTNGLWAFVADLGLSVRHVRDTPLWAVALYVQTRLCEGMKAAHIRNMTSSIRVLLTEAGCGGVNTVCSNDALGVPRRSRKGARRAYTPEGFAHAVERARAVDEGLALVITIMYVLGLRSIEALRCVPYLAVWLALLEAGANRVAFEHGAKTNRAREIEIVPVLREQTIRAIRAALEYSQAHEGHLIAGRRAGLKAARNRLRYTLQVAGLRGQLSSHALRYSYAVSLATALLDDAGVSPEETLDRVSAALGHGARAAMIRNTYLQEMQTRFKSVVIPRSKPRDPARAKRGRHLPGPLRSTRSNRSKQFHKR